MKKLTTIFGMALCLLSFTTPALAADVDNDGVDAAQISASSLANAAVNTSHALGSAKTSYTMASLNLAFGVPNILSAAVLDNYQKCQGSNMDCFISIPYAQVAHTIIDVGTLLRTAITVPVANHFAMKTNTWNLYSNHRAYDAVMWSFYGVSLGLTLFDTFNCYIDYSNGKHNLPVTISSTLVSIVPLVMVGIKAQRSYNMARSAMKGNNSSEELSDKQASLMVVPTASPFVDRNTKVSGGTFGMSMVF